MQTSEVYGLRLEVNNAQGAASRSRRGTKSREKWTGGVRNAESDAVAVGSLSRLLSFLKKRRRHLDVVKIQLIFARRALHGSQILGIGAVEDLVDTVDSEMGFKELLSGLDFLELERRLWLLELPDDLGDVPVVPLLLSLPLLLVSGSCRLPE